MKEASPKWEECVLGQEFLYGGDKLDNTVMISEMNFADSV